MTPDRRGKRIFSYDEALNTFPLVRDLTAAAVRKIEGLMAAATGRDELEDIFGELEAERERIVGIWAQEVVALGCEVKGLWLVDWDSGDGYYCWRFPEQAIGHFHSYEEGFEGRLPLN